MFVTVGLFHFSPLFVVFCFYLLPTVVAVYRGARNTLAIVLINLFLGWTFVGWVAALIWAIADSTDEHPRAIAVFCPTCGRYTPAAGSFCTYCGTRFAR